MIIRSNNPPKKKVIPLFIRIIEKIVAFSLAAWGVILLFTASRALVFLIGLVPANELSILNLFVHYHIMLMVPLASVVAGVLLIFEHRIGWAMSIITLLLNAFVWLIPQDRYQFTKFTSDNGYLMGLAVVNLVCLAAAIVLVSTPFKKKYMPGKATWVTIAGITGIVLIDRLLMLLVQ